MENVPSSMRATNGWSASTNCTISSMPSAFCEENMVRIESTSESTPMCSASGSERAAHRPRVCSTGSSSMPHSVSS